MGLFSSKKTYVSASTQKLISDTPEVAKDSVINAVLKGRDIAPDIVASYMYGIGSKLDRLYRYGRSTYYLGLPNGAYTNLSTYGYRSALAIEAETGLDITLVSSIVDFPDPFYWAMDYLVENRNYDPELDTIGKRPSGVPATAENFFIAGIEFITSTKIRVTYQYEIPTGFSFGTPEVVRIHEDIPIDEVVDVNDYYYQATYIVNGGTGKVLYWTYNSSLNTYDYLPEPIASDMDSPYYPIIPLRENNVDKLEADDTEEYIQRKKAIDILGLKIGDIQEAINGTEEEPNTDIGDLDHAYIVLGLGVTEDDPNCVKYLYEYFSELAALNPLGYDVYQRYVDGVDALASPSPVNSIDISDGVYSVALSYNYILATVEEGVKTDVGKHVREIDVRSSTKLWGVVETDRSTLTLYKQLDETTYSKIVVHGLKHTNYVYKSHTVVTTLEDAVNSTDSDPNENFIIPINRATIRRLKITEATPVYYKSLQMVFLSYQVVKLKWYQTGAFSALVTIVAIAITVFTAGTGSGFGVALATAAGVTGAAITVVAIAIDLIIMQIISTIFTYVAQYLSPELALVLGVIAIAAGQYVGNASTATNMADANSLLTSQVSTASAESATVSFGTFADSFSGAIQSGFISLPTQAIEAHTAELQNDYEQFQEEYNQTIEELEAATEELERDNVVTIDPLGLAFDFQSSQYEKVEEYYYRKLHVGNIGSLIYENVENFVEGQIVLPNTGTELSPQIFI